MRRRDPEREAAGLEDRAAGGDRPRSAQAGRRVPRPEAAAQERPGRPDRVPLPAGQRRRPEGDRARGPDRARGGDGGQQQRARAPRGEGPLRLLNRYGHRRERRLPRGERPDGGRVRRRDRAVRTVGRGARRRRGEVGRRNGPAGRMSGRMSRQQDRRDQRQRRHGREGRCAQDEPRRIGDPDARGIPEGHGVAVVVPDRVVAGEAPVEIGRGVRAGAGVDREQLPGGERDLREGVRARGPFVRDGPARQVDGVRAGVQERNGLAREAEVRHRDEAGGRGTRQQEEGDADQDRRERSHATDRHGPGIYGCRYRSAVDPRGWSDGVCSRRGARGHGPRPAGSRRAAAMLAPPAGGEGDGDEAGDGFLHCFLLEKRAVVGRGGECQGNMGSVSIYNTQGALHGDSGWLKIGRLPGTRGQQSEREPAVAGTKRIIYSSSFEI